jgi:peptide/nickel transport system permease protein
MPPPSDLPFIEPDVSPLMGGAGLPRERESSEFALESEAGAVLTEFTPGEVIPDVTPESIAAPKKRFGPIWWLCMIWLGLVTFLAVFAPYLPIPSYRRTGLGVRLTGPTAHHLFGLDDLGRDIFSRTVYGARVSLIVGFASIGMGLLIGGSFGIFAGYFRGRIETSLMAAMDILLAFPSLVLALAIVTALGQNLRDVTIAIGILAIAPIARIIRANTLTFSQREFVLASRSLGAKNRRIIVREILPNVLPPAASFALLGVAVAIVGEGALAFLGLSVPPPTPSWGSSIAAGQTVLQQDVWVSMAPAIAMLLTVLALNLAGDALRKRFEVKEGAL